MYRWWTYRGHRWVSPARRLLRIRPLPCNGFLEIKRRVPSRALSSFQTPLAVADSPVPFEDVVSCCMGQGTDVQISEPMCTVFDPKSGLSRVFRGPIPIEHQQPCVQARPKKALEIRRLRGQGAVWKVYSVSDDDSTTPLVLKVCDLASFPVRAQFDHWARPDAVRNIRKEAHLLSGPRSSLQIAPQQIIPQFQGIYVAEDDPLSWAIIMEDGGHNLEKRTLTNNQKYVLFALCPPTCFSS